MMKSVEHFPQNVREEIARVIDGLDVFRLMALRDFLQSWAGPKRSKAETQQEYEQSLLENDELMSKARVECPAIASADNPSDSGIEGKAKAQTVAKRKRGPKRKVSDETLIALHNEKLTCAEIARRAGVTEVTVSVRLKKLGLEVKKGKQGCQPRVSDEQIIALQREGLTCREIAERTRLVSSRVRVRLKKLELKAAPAPRRGNHPRCSDEAFKSLVERGLSDFEIASDLEITRKAVSVRRKKLGLPSASHFRPKQEPAPRPEPVIENGVKKYPAMAEDPELAFSRYAFGKF